MPLKSAKRSGWKPGVRDFVSLVWLQQVVDQHLGVDLFLDVERRGVDDEVAPVLLILAAPDELGIEVGVARDSVQPAAAGLVLLEHGLVLGGGDVLPLGLVVLEGFDGLWGGGLLGHELMRWWRCRYRGRLLR